MEEQIQAQKQEALVVKLDLQQAIASFNIQINDSKKQIEEQKINFVAAQRELLTLLDTFNATKTDETLKQTIQTYNDTINIRNELNMSTAFQSYMTLQSSVTVLAAELRAHTGPPGPVVQSYISLYSLSH